MLEAQHVYTSKQDLVYSCVFYTGKMFKTRVFPYLLHTYHYDVNVGTKKLIT